MSVSAELTGAEKPIEPICSCGHKSSLHWYFNGEFIECRGSKNGTRLVPDAPATCKCECFKDATQER